MSEVTETPSSPESTPVVDPAITPAPTPTPATTEPTPAPAVEPAASVVAEPLTMAAIKLPDGVTIDEGLSTRFLEVMNNNELSAGERAQSLIDLQTEAVSMMAAANQTQYDEMQEKWKGEIKADPVVGGPNFITHSNNIGKMLDEFGTPDLREAFDLTGAGNNPAIFRFMSKLAGQLTEGKFVSGGTPSDGQQTAAQKLFPTMKG